MLYATRDLLGRSIHARDGEIGRLDDLFFDDRSWMVRYLVVQAGNWLEDRRVLISPVAVDDLAGQDDPLSVALTRDQVRESPPIDLALPVSRQMEAELHQFYGWPAYWAPLSQTAVMAGLDPPTAVDTGNVPEPAPRGAESDPHLRSVRDLEGYRLEATDGEVGHVDGFLLDGGDWLLRYLVADMGTWLPGRKVLVAPRWVRDFRWGDQRAEVDLDRGLIEQAPEYDASRPVSREYEQQLYRHYHRPPYWE